MSYIFTRINHVSRSLIIAKYIFIHVYFIKHSLLPPPLHPSAATAVDRPMSFMHITHAYCQFIAESLVFFLLDHFLIIISFFVAYSDMWFQLHHPFFLIILFFCVFFYVSVIIYKTRQSASQEIVFSFVGCIMMLIYSTCTQLSLSRNCTTRLF